MDQREGATAGGAEEAGADAASPSRPPPPAPGDADAELDRRAMTQIAAGDLSGFDALVDRHKDRLFRHILRRVRDPHRAEDLAQESFLRLFRAARAGGYTAHARVVTWLFAIAGNCVTDHLRAEGRRSRLTLVSPADNVDRSPGPGDLAEQREMRDWAADLLAELPEPQRAVVELKVLDGLSFPDVAELLGCPIPTVKSRLVYGLRKLRRALGEPRRKSS